MNLTCMYVSSLQNHAPFKIMSWKREAGMWHYVYACEKPECEASKDNKEIPCAKIYVDLYRTEDKVDEVRENWQRNI